MRSLLAAFAIATVIAALLTPLVRWAALRGGVVAHGGGRHVHERKIPRLGGVAICVALLTPILGLLSVESVVAAMFQQEFAKVVGLCGGGVAMCALGVADDTRGLRALHKMLFQVLIACGAFWLGYRIDAITLPLIGSLEMGIFALPITVLWIVGIVNAVNLIDGLDGLAAGVVFFAGITNLTIAVLGAQMIQALVMAAMLGAVLGFLFHNFNPARIFMGDSGSYLLGYVLAATAIVGATHKASTAVSLLVPIVALGLPIFDTLFAMVRRYLERRPLFAPDRGHIHHRLLDLGITHRRAVLILYGCSVVFTVASIAIYLGRAWQAGLALLVFSVVIIGLGRFVGYFSVLHLRKRQMSRFRSRDTELLRHALPQIPQRLAECGTEERLLSELARLAAEAELVHLSVEAGGETLFSWSDEGDDERRVLASMRYPLGPDGLARAQLCVSVVNDQEHDRMLPQTDILLQVLTDIVATNLVRLNSERAPQRPEQRPSRPNLPPQADSRALAKTH